MTKNLGILRTKRAFKMKKKIFISLNGLPVVRICLILDSAPLLILIVALSMILIYFSIFYFHIYSIRKEIKKGKNIRNYSRNKEIYIMIYS